MIFVPSALKSLKFFAFGAKMLKISRLRRKNPSNFQMLLFIFKIFDAFGARMLLLWQSVGHS